MQVYFTAFDIQVCGEQFFQNLTISNKIGVSAFVQSLTEIRILALTVVILVVELFILVWLQGPYMRLGPMN